MSYISSGGLEKLKQELQERKTIKRQEIARRLEEAKSLGDLSENMEYTSAKEEQAFNEGRILELEKIIKESSIIQAPIKSSRQKVQLGSVVEVKMLDKNGKIKNDKQVFSIIGSQESNPLEGKISNESPLGKAFLGHQVNDIIEVSTPRGKVKYKIIKIR